LAACLASAVAVATAGCSGSDSAADTPATTTPAPGVATTPAPAGPTTRATLASSAARARKQLRGIRQRGLLLGDPKAPITIVEYGAFDCPACAAVHRDVLPQVIERYVRTGKASIEFRGVAGEAPSVSRELALASQAASAQKRGWEFVQLAYLRSLEGARPGTEAEPVARLARALGLDATRLAGDASEPESLTELRAAANVAAAARFSAFPVFLLRARARPDDPFVVLTRPGTAGSFVDAVAEAEVARG
jgi:hypothetical protein